MGVSWLLCLPRNIGGRLYDRPGLAIILTMTSLNILLQLLINFDGLVRPGLIYLVLIVNGN